VRRLTKQFDRSGAAALHELSLDVQDGEFLVLFGPSGCGKTTALRCIAGLEEPTAGEIRIGDRDVTGLPPGARDVAMVFQNLALYPHLSVADNLAFPLVARRLSRSDVERRVAAAAARLRITDLLDRRPAQLSHGQRQRVALGRAFVREPLVFLFDEPLSHLDATLRFELRNELLALHASLRTTMVYVTPDQAEAMMLGQRIAVLYEGRLRQVGSGAELYAHPADAFVARLIGSPGMNVLEGRGGSGEWGVVWCGSLKVPVPESVTGVVQVGIRPEHIALLKAGSGNGDADVRAVEPLGSETLIHLDAGGMPLVAKLLGLPSFTPGRKVGVKLDAKQLHLFDISGARLA